MPTQLTPGEDDQAAIMACIGFVCIQWALLEQTLMMILCNCQNVPNDEAAIMFGSLDMKPRLNMAINLAEHHKWPQPLRSRLRSLRTRIDKEKLIDRRNLIVHGVQYDVVKPYSVGLYTPRRKGSAQNETWTVNQAHQLGLDIQTIHKEANNIFMDYGQWKFGGNTKKDPQGEVVTAQLGAIARIKQYLRSRLNGG